MINQLTSKQGIIILETQFSELKLWLKLIEKFISLKESFKFYYNTKDHRLTLTFHIKENRYSILVRYTEKNQNGFLGCKCSRNHTKEIDIYNGEYNYETFVKILGGIISHEIIPIK